MERYMDLLRETVEATLAPGRSMSLEEISQAISSDSRVPPAVIRMLAVSLILMLEANPDRFIEVAPGVWARRSEGPDAGVHSRQPRRPLAGSAAAAVVPPEPARDVRAIGRPGPAAG